MRIGFGYDVHAFAPNRELWLGGILVPSEQGLLGHSDADVLVHALMDAMLGALALGDIGKLFPDTDAAYSGADSIELLKKVALRVAAQGYALSNADCTIIAQRPKMAPHIENMRCNIASAIGVDVSQISVKATTEEHLGFTGKKEGISAHSVCILKNKE